MMIIHMIIKSYIYFPKHTDISDGHKACSYVSFERFFFPSIDAYKMFNI